MWVIEEAVSPSLLLAAWATWPDAKWRGWHHYRGRDSEKYGTKSRGDIPYQHLRAIDLMIERVSGIVKPCAFPDYDLFGAGLHMIPPGGYLRKHLDSSMMESTGWKREYSCVLGVNPNWEKKWGGEFVLGDNAVRPAFNQMILFETTEDAYHEVREVTGPDARCTLAVFFWSEEAPTDLTRTNARFFYG